MSKKQHDATKINHQRKVIARMNDTIKGLKQLIADQKVKIEFWKGRWEKEKAKNGTNSSIDKFGNRIDSLDGVAGNEEVEEGNREVEKHSIHTPETERRSPDECGTLQEDLGLRPEDAPLDSGEAGPEFPGPDETGTVGGEPDIRGSSDTGTTEQGTARSLDMPGVDTGTEG
jgi:hypothetical protein